jgi:hypothetical protein
MNGRGNHDDGAPVVSEVDFQLLVSSVQKRVFESQQDQTGRENFVEKFGNLALMPLLLLHFSFLVEQAAKFSEIQKEFLVEFLLNFLSVLVAVGPIVHDGIGALVEVSEA